MSKDITSATAKIKLISAVTPAGVNFEQYSADNAWGKEVAKVIESRMGVDGKISFGYTPAVRSASFTFQPNSPTLDALQRIVSTQNTAMKPIVCQLVISLGSVDKSFMLNNACITNGDLLPAGAKVLEPVEVNIEYESIEAMKL